MPTPSLPHDHGHDVDALLRRMPDADHFRDAAAAFQQISDPTRLRIVWLLCHCEECVSNLAAMVDMTDAAVSHHLRHLRQSGLVKTRRAGKEVHYSLADTPKAQLLHRVIEEYFQMSCPDAPTDD